MVVLEGLSRNLLNFEACFQISKGLPVARTVAQRHESFRQNYILEYRVITSHWPSYCPLTGGAFVMNILITYSRYLVPGERMPDGDKFVYCW